MTVEAAAPEVKAAAAFRGSVWTSVPDMQIGSSQIGSIMEAAILRQSVHAYCECRVRVHAKPVLDYTCIEEQHYPGVVFGILALSSEERRRGGERGGA